MTLRLHQGQSDAPVAIVSVVTGQELQAFRRAMKVSQTRLGELIGCSRQTVSKWENTPRIEGWALRRGLVARMCKVLKIEVLPINPLPTHARGGGVLLDSQQVWLDRECARLNAKAMERVKHFRQPCGATTRKGLPCRNKSEAGRRRCKFHGGRSTGPKTLEGKARIADAQKRRWRAYRASLNGLS